MLHHLERLLLLSAVICAVAGVAIRGQERPDVIGFGAQYARDRNPVRWQRELDDMHRLGFNVVALSPAGRSTGVQLAWIDRLLEGRADVTFTATSIGRVHVARASARAVTHEAWYLLGRGARYIIFDDWAGLRRNDAALTAAVDFAHHITRNAALYGPLRPRVRRARGADVIIPGEVGNRVSARFLESADALLLVVTSEYATQSKDVTMRFSPEIPEAIWQNMLTGTAVNFVAGPDGPTYTRTFAPHDVLVLMIRKKWR